MTTAQLFRDRPAEFLDPRVQHWSDQLAATGTSARLEVDWPPYHVERLPPELIIHLAKDGGPDAPSEPMPWDDDLNRILVNRAVRALDDDQEALRASLALRAAFRRASIEVGDGYFNGVFFQVLRDLGLAQHSSLQPLVEVADYIHIIDKVPPSDRYARCHSIIQTAIQTVAFDLTNHLKYPQAEAEAILIAGLVDYIDRRFSVSIRRQQGLF